MAERVLSPEEVWLQDSEARLESMEILLKSVRRDIDALSEKLPSPRPGTRRTFQQEGPVVYESGGEDYVLRIDKRPRCYQNLGLGSHTTMEPFDDEEDTERPTSKTRLQKSWRSPADFRPVDSPPDSPTFGESSNIISLNDIILNSDDTLPSSQKAEPSRVVPLLGSLHSLPTIEENSQEDNTDTSISTAEDLKSADYSASAVCGMASSDTIIGPMREPLSNKTRSKCSLDEVMNLSQEQIKSAQSPLSRSRSQSPFITDPDFLRYSRTSLRSRDSTVSETDSFVTVNSQFFPSGEEAYVTACSDTESLGDSPDGGRVPSRERMQKKMLVLQQNPPSECQNQSEDVLEFTLVEANMCKTPVPEKESPFPRKTGESAEQPDAYVKKPIKRRTLRKRRPDDSPSDDGEGDTSSSFTCDEGVYNAVAARLVGATTTYKHEELPITILPGRLSCIEEVNRLSNGIDSPDGEEDIVVHYGDDEREDEMKYVYGEPGHKTQQPNIPEVVLTHLGNVLPTSGKNETIGFDEKSLDYVDDFKPYKHGVYHPTNDGHTLPNLADGNTDPEIFASTSFNVTRTDSYPSNKGRQSITVLSFVPRVDIFQRGIDNRSHQARRDYFSGSRSSNTFFMGDTEGRSSHPTSSPNDQPDLPQRSTQRSKSVSGQVESTSTGTNLQACIVRAGMKETQDNIPNGRMYSRSCSRYRSTDIDVALANTAILRENLAGTSFNDDSQKRKMASSLFDLSARRQFSMSNNLQFLSGKSTNSLLETDIDTGEQKNQQIILETDVDTLNTYRLVGGFASADQGPIQSTNDKTYSLFNLTYLNSTGQSRRPLADDNKHQSRADAHKRAQSLSGITKSIDNQRSELKPGASSLVARLRARARSNHELRVAESLTRIHVPEWLDKADLSKPLSPLHTSPSPPPPPLEKSTLPYSRASLPSTTVVQSAFTNGVEERFLKGKTVETVAKPVWSLVPPLKTEIHRPLRPSQILRERNASSGPKLVPIKSLLRGSMKSQITERADDSSIDRGVILRAGGSVASSRPVHLTPEDFFTRDEKIWGHKFNPHILLPMVCTTGTSAELIQAPKAPFFSASSSLSSKSLQKTQCRNGHSVRINGEARLSDPNDSGGSIKVADSDSVVENQFYQSMEIGEIQKSLSRSSDEEIYEEVKRSAKLVPPLSVPRTSPSASIISTPAATSNPHSPTWHNADSDGETETAATDGLDNISDLTCLTDLLDKYSARHFTLLQNRPSALENILLQFGWWSNAPNTGLRQQSRESGDYVALAASYFNPDEDSHRTEFFALLTSPAGQGPMILTEYGFDQKRIGLDRNPKDGMLYLHCNNPSCPRMGPARVDRVRSWRTCTNCFTAYCSPKCREQALPIHNMVCNFGRIRLVCGRILHHLAPSQQSSLTALAKAGATRLGRGGILITFASVQDAEFFLTRSTDLPLRQPQQQPEVVSAGRPGPSGLIAPPIYLTVEELNKLDSKLATPCKLYKPSASYVLIVIICAYDLEMMKNGRAVHLYKQCIILPFPVTAAKVATPTPQIKSPRPKVTTISWTRPKTTKEEREAYSKQLQRTLRERGVSLRNSEPEVYKRLSKFVETGETFEPVEFDFNDYYSNQVITCKISPMEDVVIHQKKDSDAIVAHETQHLKAYPKKKSYKISRPRIGETEL
uniref:CAP-Gly domain-containing protein n=1 Tax=Echinococcus granulosus TaxID=6210 RepID=A0A068WP00_ECHGR|nr:hypothetical protein EgrG_000100100 [Echinococcus granulosus]